MGTGGLMERGKIAAFPDGLYIIPDQPRFPGEKIKLRHNRGRKVFCGREEPMFSQDRITNLVIERVVFKRRTGNMKEVYLWGYERYYDLCLISIRQRKEKKPTT